MTCIIYDICPECILLIASLGEGCVDVCTLAIKNYDSEFPLEKFDPIKDPLKAEAVEELEKQGIFTTTEVSEIEISFKLSNSKLGIIDNIHCFCWCADDE